MYLLTIFVKAVKAVTFGYYNVATQILNMPIFTISIPSGNMSAQRHTDIENVSAWTHMTDLFKYDTYIYVCTYTLIHLY